MIKVNLWRGNGRDLTTRKMGTLSRLSELRVLCTTTVRSMMFRLLMDIILEKLSRNVVEFISDECTSYSDSAPLNCDR